MWRSLKTLVIAIIAVSQHVGTVESVQMEAEHIPLFPAECIHVVDPAKYPKSVVCGLEYRPSLIWENSKSLSGAAHHVHDPCRAGTYWPPTVPSLGQFCRPPIGGGKWLNLAGAGGAYVIGRGSPAVLECERGHKSVGCSIQAEIDLVQSDVCSQLCPSGAVNRALSPDASAQSQSGQDGGSGGEYDARPNGPKLPFGGKCGSFGGRCSLLLGYQIGGLVGIGLGLTFLLMGGVIVAMDYDYRKWRARGFAAALAGLAGWIWFGLFLAQYWAAR